MRLTRQTVDLWKYVGLSLFLAGSLSAQQKQLAPGEFISWLPISDAERQMQAPSVEKNAGAEVLFWRVHVVDEYVGRSDIQRVFYHYIRMKVFNDAGKEQVSTVDLDYGDRSAIISVSGRTIKADGSIVELAKNAVYKRDLERIGGRKRRVTSFAMPGVEPGAIIEYRWQERLDSNAIMYQVLQFQREYPVQKVTYFVKPLADQVRYKMNIQAFHCALTPPKPDNDGYDVISIENVPAFHEEPYSPSEPNLRAWALLYYQEENAKDPDKFWNEVGRKVFSEMKAAMKSNDALKSATAEVIAGAKTDEEKVSALIAYVRKTIRNLNDSSVTAAERERFFEKLPKGRDRTAAEIFDSRLGTSYEINVVFGAMAAQAGLETRPAYVSDWWQAAFNPKVMTARYFLDDLDTAVKLGGSWKFYDVGNKLLAPGEMAWRQEGMFALLADPKTPSFVITPYTPAKASQEKKIAHLKLSRDGTLAGDVEEIYTGHSAFDRRLELRDESAERREQALKDRLQKMFPSAEITSIEIQNAEDPSQPLRYRYHLDAPQYAQITGKRIFFHILPFERARVSPFTASERHNIIAFPYGSTESDEISVQLPDGMSLDNAEVPGTISFGNIGNYTLKVSVTNHVLTTTRELTFPDSNLLVLERERYAALKQIYSEIQRRDSHTLALKEN